MSLLIAVPCAIGAALAYGTSNAVQHSAVQESIGDAGEGETSRLLSLLRNPRWLASVGGDTVGLLLQVIALATGPVVLIAPLLVLAVPVSLPVGWLLGGPRPNRRDYLACLSILLGLGIFTALIGDPQIGRPLPPISALVAIGSSLLIGLVICLAVRGQRGAVRAGVMGGVSGAGFGLVGVLLNAATGAWNDGGADEFLSARGLVPGLGVILIGAASMTVLQISFQVGPLAASFPANESAAPLIAVLLGGWLLHETVPISPAHTLAYLFCLALVITGTIQLGLRSSAESAPAAPAAPAASP